MFSFLKPKLKTGSEIELQLSGLHCTSCALNIDSALEELDGVIEANTNYQTMKCTVNYLPEKIDEKLLKSTITGLGYQVV